MSSKKAPPTLPALSAGVLGAVFDTLDEAKAGTLATSELKAVGFNTEQMLPGGGDLGRAAFVGEIGKMLAKMPGASEKILKESISLVGRIFRLRHQAQLNDARGRAVEAAAAEGRQALESLKEAEEALATARAGEGAAEARSQQLAQELEDARAARERTAGDLADALGQNEALAGAVEEAKAGGDAPQLASALAAAEAAAKRAAGDLGAALAASEKTARLLAAAEEALAARSGDLATRDADLAAAREALATKDGELALAVAAAERASGDGAAALKAEIAERDAEAARLLAEARTHAARSDDHAKAAEAASQRATKLEFQLGDALADKAAAERAAGAAERRLAEARDAATAHDEIFKVALAGVMTGLGLAEGALDSSELLAAGADPDVVKAIDHNASGVVHPDTFVEVLSQAVHYQGPDQSKAMLRDYTAVAVTVLENRQASAREKEAKKSAIWDHLVCAE